MALLVVATAFSSPANACRCNKPSPRLAYRLADLVVMGSVESQQSQGDAVTTIVVEHAWKRAVSRRIEVISSKPCGFPFVAAAGYFVFLTTIRRVRLEPADVAGTYQYQALPETRC